MKKYHIKNARGKVVAKLSCKSATFCPVGALAVSFAGSKIKTYLWLPPAATVKRVKR